MLLARHWRAVVAAVVAIGATWTGTAIMLNARWLPEWLDAVVPFVERDAEVNAANSISLLGFLQAVWSPEATPAVVVGALGAAGIVVALMWMWWHYERFSIADRMGALAIGMLLISPHTMFYDALVLVIAGAALLDRRDRGLATTNVAVPLALVWVLGLSQAFARSLGATPLALVVAGCFAIFLFTASRNEGVRYA